MAPADPEIRDAAPSDLTRIFAIYNAEVEHGIATFDTEPKVAGRDDTWLTGRDPIHPVLVAVRAARVAGWASLGPFSPRGGYRRTAEVSVYVDADARGAGLGGRLLEALIARARAGGDVRVLLARIALPNPASIALHEAAGFRSFGTQRACGEKLGRVLDVELLDLHL